MKYVFALVMALALASPAFASEHKAKKKVMKKGAVATAPKTTEAAPAAGHETAAAPAAPATTEAPAKH